MATAFFPLIAACVLLSITETDATTCVCGPGTYLSTNQCLPCPAGKFTETAAASEAGCKDCAALHVAVAGGQREAPPVANRLEELVPRADAQSQAGQAADAAQGAEEATRRDAGPSGRITECVELYLSSIRRRF